MLVAAPGVRAAIDPRGDVDMDQASDGPPVASRAPRGRESARRRALSLAGMREQTGIPGGIPRRQPDVLLTREQQHRLPRSCCQVLLGDMS